MKITNNNTKLPFTSLSFYKNLSKKYIDKKLFSFLDDSNNITYLSGATLTKKVMLMNNKLQKLLAPQDVAIVLLPQGLGYISSVLSCFYANVTVIPTSLINADVKPSIITDKILPIFQDAGAKCIITDTNFKKLLEENKGFEHASIVCVDELEESDTIKFKRPRKSKLEDIALMLYTSGSTAKPKGVMLTHTNVMSQAISGAEQYRVQEESCIVSWMPQFHSFGLFFNFLVPLLKGASSVILPPDSFVKNPYKWFEMINEYQATHTAAPNFAFDYCCSSLDITKLKQISLSLLKAIICGGEPIRRKTYENFIEKFHGLGLKKNIFCPHYGMSEVGAVTAKNTGEQIRFLSLDIPSLEKGIIKLSKRSNTSKSVSSCGMISEDVQILCINTETGSTCKSDEVGEIWIKSPSVAKGYFNQPEETKKIFNRIIVDSGATGFFRTGDLGFIKEKHLYIIGREKEVIIVNGKNHHPVDIEWAVKNKFPNLTLPICVFSYELDQQEKIIIVQETEVLNITEYKNISQEILNCIAETYMLDIYEVNIVKKGTIPRTGSGKIQRKNCKNLYKQGKLLPLFNYQTGAIQKEEIDAVAFSKDFEREILKKLKNDVLSNALDIAPEKLENVMSFSELGFDSIKYIKTSKWIEEVFKIEFTPVMLFKHNTIYKLAEYLSTQIERPDVSKIQQPEIKETDLDKVDIKEEEDTSIAVIGISCNFPGDATNPELFWDNIVNEKDCVSAIARNRPEIIEDYQNLYGESVDFSPKWGGFIKGVDQFDAAFFGISPLEAESMDPQQRKILQLTWNVIEDGGYDPASLSGKDIGLFIGAHSNDYAELISKRPSLIDTYGAYADSGLHMSMIPHRTSRWFDFHGPSEIINTACSSSLVAIHHAVESINKGESTMAIAGGINLIFSSRIYIASQKAGMLSKDGHCKTFDDKADGFVRSEGYGAVLLKPYKEALKDNDTIYGIIKGKAINHDGKSNSLRAPNLNAQKQLIKSAYTGAGIPVDTISYIETHGTGTSLGDPIEFQALKEAFQEIGANMTTPFCGLGAVKSVIGHTESAAGIAGFIKVLLSIKEKTLPGILHFNKLNEYISLEKTPFYILDKTQEWERLKDSDGQEIPRRAGISSFGFGGGNAHVILEEHISESNQAPTEVKKAIIPLSAKNKERLLSSAQNIINYLEEKPDKSLNLLNLSYTLQVGRNDMEERVAFVVQDIQELKEKINLYIEGNNHIEECWYGNNTKGNKDIESQFGSDEDPQELISKWFAKNKFSQIAQSWAQGVDIKWNLLYKENKPHRINLPTYPFADTRYWIPKSDLKTNLSFNKETIKAIHPLSQENTSDFTAQRFSTTFSGKEFFLSDHIINGQRVLPGVVYLEMARASLMNSYKVFDDANNGVIIRDVIWNHPVIVDKEPVQIHVALYPENNEQFDYEIYTKKLGNESETISHSQGCLVVEPVTSIKLDLNTIKTECKTTEIAGEELYSRFSKKGINYGSGFKTIEKINLDKGIALAKLNLSSSLEDGLSQFLLHPSILDAAFHASSVFITESEDYLALPYKIKEVEIHGKSSSRMWAKIEHCNYDSEQEGINTFNIMLCDDDGNVCVNIKELTVIRVENNFGIDKAKSEVKTVMLSPDWKEQPISENDTREEFEERLLILIEPEQAFAKKITTEIKSTGVQSIVFKVQEKEIEERYTNYALKLFKELQSIIKDDANKKVFVQVVASTQGSQKTFMGLVGMLKTAFQEYPHCIVQFIGVDSWEFVSPALLNDNSYLPWQAFIQYKNNKRYSFDWSIVQDSSYKEELWKTDGVYIITGGLGGLGTLFAEEIIDKTQNPVIILTGRSTFNEEKKKKVQTLEKDGAIVEYKQTDITKISEVESLIEDTLERFGKLNGIIHSAGIIRDNYIINKTEEELKEVLEVKVRGSVNLDKASETIPLDFLILFSSVAGSLGNPGQADYSTANAFMDNFAVHRNDLVASQKRGGHTLSVNWPLWEEGGMQVSSDVQDLMEQNMGMLPMKTSNGLESLYRAFATGNAQIMVIEGYEEKIHAFIKKQVLNELLQKSLKKKPSTALSTISPELLEEKAINYFKKLISSVTKLPVKDIDANAHMDEYGIDSIIIMQLTTRLEKDFGIIPKTLFFEYKSIKTLTGYFLEDFNAQLVGLFGLDKEIIETNTTNNSEEHKKPVEIESIERKRPRFTNENNNSKMENSLKNEDIAIIGLSGQYPDSQDIHEFWDVIKDGKDCITEIPKERWDSSLYFDENKKAKGKTYTKWGGFLKGVDEFDPLFFNISPLEAEMMDPQERLFLQCVHKAIEDAGYSKEHLVNTQEGTKASKTGVFVGVMFQEYQLFGAQEQAKGKSLAVSGNIASIANRVSYFYNLHGPSMTVDTMCSSSLSALHLACQSLHNSECEFAIAGGVNVSIHPNKYLLLAQGNFASSKGKCESFGQGGDGYVPGEGVGAVLLKPLSKAIKDGNHIYGVIKSTAINHGGKTNGYTVPNPSAQAEVIEEALISSGIDPNTINYIEAHGTGTSLGDPIEMAGLTKAFKKYTGENQFCAIGSVKSNIGHCESAAGMAGITKILMQMKHKQLVPSLHSKELNSNIDFTNSPFVVQQELAKWEQVRLTENGKTKEYPRRAGLSSFGAGGSNAHVIFEEYIPSEERSAEVVTTQQNPAIILLSAKNEKRLKEQAENLLKALKREQFLDEDLIDIAYTLQVGRSAMQERMAMTVTSVSQLENNLITYLENKDSAENIYRGNSKKDKVIVGVLGLDDDIQKAVGSWINKKKYEKLLNLWVAGLNIDWGILYPDAKPKRVSLPTYPFAKERYWVPISDAISVRSGGKGQLHPLLHSNESNLSEQKYQSIYSGSELFFTDHKVRGQKVLPGVAYLELVRAAGSLSLEHPVTQFRDVKWLSPIQQVNDLPIAIEVGIFEDSEGFGYEVYSGSSEAELIHSQGTLGYGVFPAPPSYNISKLRSSFTSEKEGSTCYTIFQDLGIEYGLGFQGIEKLYYNSEGCLSKIGLTRDDDYVLQPGVLDSALQTCIGLGFDDLDSQLDLPFSIKEVTIYGDVSESFWCYARKSNGSQTSKVLSYDIDLLSESGAVLLSMKDFVTLPVDGFQNQTTGIPINLADSVSLAPELHLYGTSWKEEELENILKPSGAKDLVILSGGSASLSDKLRGSLECKVVSVKASDELSYYNKLQELIQSILETKESVRITVLYRNSEYLNYGFITGLLRTAEQENPNLSCKTIGLDHLSVKELESIKEVISSEFSNDRKAVRYQGGTREVRVLGALPLETPSTNLPIKEGGVYLITGGCGGLGLIFAKHLSTRPGVQLILTGRSKTSKLNDRELSSLGAVYHSCDVGNQESVDLLISELKNTYGRLDGIVHSAGVLRDSFLLNKTLEEATAVLSPKILGTKYLDESTKDLDLDFMIYFSSMAGVLGNIGQADYSSGNAWMDLYADYRNDLVSKGKRKGISLSINWPLWSEGGMGIDAEIEKHLESKTGLVSLPTSEGIRAFDLLLSESVSQGVVFYGSKDRFEHLLLNKTEDTDANKISESVVVTDQLLDATTAYMKTIFSSVLKLPSERIDIESSFSEYGIDSILNSKLTDRLGKFLDDLPVTLFFEYQTLSSLSSYLAESYTERLLELTGLNEDGVEIKTVLPKEGFSEVDLSLSRRKRSLGFSNKGSSSNMGNFVKEDIAIIGLSGRYPGAATIEDFWNNLKMGKDSIIEIPVERWDIEGMFDPEKGKIGKIASKWGGFIDDVDKFDPLFFNISPREAELMDPQERLFLQTAWETIEDGGYNLDQLGKIRSSEGVGLGGHVGVYVGVMYGEYQLFGAEESLKGNPTVTWCSPSSIANRVSYSLNLHGPSMGVDTMCSSSLVSIHLAIDAIHNGLCSMAIAGGVNVSIHPNKYKNLSQSMFVSDKGRCESFGEGGNGYVPSEGVGAVLLKPLSQAAADGDQIYGVIKGSSLNHGGKANGYTVPNPSAQAGVIKEAITRAGVKPEDFSYIEAHGTGTSLGDPIEIAGLSKAFIDRNKEGQYCSIGSVKSNIGHAESAAGISGLTKVLLQLKHKQLVPSLHSKILNSGIDFEKTPFKVQQELEDWIVPDDRLRLAGISAFGAGGSNAHLVVEEYVPIEKQAYQSNDAAIILVSAKDKDRLQEQVINLQSYLDTHQETNIYDLGYTLQIGREAMEERLAFIVKDIDSLLEEMEIYLSGNKRAFFSGKKEEITTDFLLEGEAGKGYIEIAVKQKESKALVQLWIRGMKIDWELLYDKENTPNKLSLPTYPFAKEHYWVAQTKSLEVSNTKSRLHPLLHSNESDLIEQKFQSLFTGQEYFLSDHIVNNDKILPGVAYLEMAREAGSLSTRSEVVQLSDVTWTSPIRVGDVAKKINITILPDKDQIGFEVYTENEREKPHCQGKMNTSTSIIPIHHDLAEIRKTFTSSMNRKECYTYFDELGIAYGPSFQGIQELWFNDTSVLSQITLENPDGMILPPGLMDSAFHSCFAIGFKEGQDSRELSLPYSFKKMNLHGKLPSTVWAFGRLSSQKNGINNCDLDILDSEGKVLLSFKDLVSLPVDGFLEKHNNMDKKEKEISEAHIYECVWQDTAVSVESNMEVQELLLLVGSPLDLTEKLSETLAQEVIHISGDNELDYYNQVFEQVQSRMNSTTPCKITLMYCNDDYVQYAFVIGLLKTAGVESKNISSKTIGVPSLTVQDFSFLEGVLESERYDLADEVRYLGDNRQVKLFEALEASPSREADISIKEGGVYLITGGAGGLGRVFANHLSGTKDVKLILVGRSSLTPEKESIISQIPGAEYYSCDITVKEEVVSLIEKVKQQYTKIDGIIHSAGIGKYGRIVDGSSLSDIETVLNPKINGTKYLDEVTKNEDLDFMILFSSVASVFGDLGLSHYASANAYQDHYSWYRNSLEKSGLRKGATFSINWGLWEEGGLQSNEESKEYLANLWGMSAMPSLEGLSAFNKLMTHPTSQALIMYGFGSKISETLMRTRGHRAVKVAVDLGDSYSVYKEAVLTYLKEVLNLELKIPLEKIDPTVTFDVFGIDSITTIRLTNRLNDFFEELSVTLFFEYLTLDDLSNYIVNEYTTKVSELIDKNEHSSKTESNVPQPTLDSAVTLQKANRFDKIPEKDISNRREKMLDKEPIAIIGLGGRYPGAATIDDFWENLKMGKDSVTEVPKDRWDNEAFYDSEKGNPGKIATKWGGFIDDVDKFDPLFFNMSPSKAVVTDPQERIFLQTAWETIEDAGYTLDQLSKVRSSQGEGIGGHVGVYVGVMYGEYQLFGAEQALKGNLTSLTTWSSPSSIANRVSFSMNLHGPSMGVDTMCSSSLVSIHLAIDAINNGMCSMAIAGGVNISIHPNKYKLLSQNHFVSDKGRCESFGEGGNGYVPSEGVGAVLLKPLSQAELDGDQIYGVIKGGSLNHGGKVSGYTVPNSNAQASVIKEAMLRSGVSPDDFSYIEAHGTGTSLGDPIEIAGLSKAFKEGSSKQGQYCALGSVKSNIGHAESAAGISGLTKVLLQLKYKQLVPSLHSKTLNSLINFEKTPFKVQQELEDWVSPDGRPRLAGLSGFGAGGSNAHLVIEEYIPKENKGYQYKGQSVIAISAKSKDRLEEQVVNLQSYLDKYQKTNIYDLAYTLQIGREPMEERLAIVVNDVKDLKNKLVNFKEGKTEDLFIGSAEDKNSDLLLEGKALDLYIKAVVSEKQPKSLAQLWVRGITIDWYSLYEKGNIPNKISLPTYPFKKVRYWLPQLEKNKGVLSNLNNLLHPLLHSNNSKFNKQLFTSTYTGLEPFLSDHRVGGEKMLPGVAQLELAREAGDLSKDKNITQIKDVIWMNPISVNGKPKSIEISLFEEGDAIGYKVLSNSIENAEESITHGEGFLSTEELVAPESINIEEIKNQLSNEKSGSECYAIFKKLGLDYRSSFQGIEKLWYSNTVAISRIKLPQENGYTLQPGILDSALQTSIILEMGMETKDNSSPSLSIPFSVNEVNLYGDVKDASWCYVRKKNSHKRKSTTSSYDIDLISSSGDVLLSFKGFIILPVGGKPSIEKKHRLVENKVKTHFYTDYWQPCNPKTNNPKESKLVLLAGGSEELSKRLRKKTGLEVEPINHHDEMDYFNEVFQKIKKSIKDDVFMDITIIYNNRDRVKYGFISGLLRTAISENKRFTGRAIGVDNLSIKSMGNLVDILKSENQSEYAEIRYKNNTREEKYYEPITDFDTSGVKIKEGGVYLITGGAGGLGFIFAEHISKTKNTKLILTGRSKLSDEKKLRLNSIANSEYVSCDVTDSFSVEKVIKNIIKTYGKLDGIIHSAGAQRDSLIINKTSVEIKEVLTPKIQGTKNLDKATKDLALDFFMLFSSLSGALGNLGQSDYAPGNAYLDNFAGFRNELKDKGKRTGNSYSINWPLWIDGGMHPKEEVIDYMFTVLSLKPIPTEEGVAIFDRILESGTPGNLVLFGQNMEILEKKLLFQKPNEETLENLIEELITTNSIDSMEALIDRIPEENIEDLLTVFSTDENLLDSEFNTDIENIIEALISSNSIDSLEAFIDKIPDDSLQELISIIENH